MTLNLDTVAVAALDGETIDCLQCGATFEWRACAQRAYSETTVLQIGTHGAGQAGDSRFTPLRWCEACQGRLTPATNRSLAIPLVDRLLDDQDVCTLANIDVPLTAEEASEGIAALLTEVRALREQITLMQAGRVTKTIQVLERDQAGRLLRALLVESPKGTP